MTHLWENWNMGGNCRALGIGGDRYHVLMTDVDGTNIPDDNESVMVGLYANDGQFGQQAAVIVLYFPCRKAADEAIAELRLDDDDKH